MPHHDHNHNHNHKRRPTWFGIVGVILAGLLLALLLNRCSTLTWPFNNKQEQKHHTYQDSQTGDSGAIPPNSGQSITPGAAEDGFIVTDDPEMELGDKGVYEAKGIIQKRLPFFGEPYNITAANYAKRYLGTPYEYGSNRKLDNTFDCSDLVQWSYHKGTGLQLPLSSRTQADYIKKFGRHRFNDWKRAAVGDLLFFTDYRGSKASDYANRSTTISHVGISLGNGYMIHTASQRSGGVRIDNIYKTPHLQYRFIYMGLPY